MPWQQESPLGAAAGAAAAFLQGQEQAKERKQAQDEQTYMDKVYAAHTAAEERIAEDRISEQAKAAELKRVTDEEQNSYRQLEAALRGKYDDAHIQLAEQQLSASIAEHKATIQASLTNREAEDATRMAVAQLEASTREMIAQLVASTRLQIHDTSGAGRAGKQTPLTPRQKILETNLEALQKANPQASADDLRATAKAHGYTDKDIDLFLPPAAPQGGLGWGTTSTPGKP